MDVLASALTLDELRQIDEVCDSFESAWQQTSRPEIEPYLARIGARTQPSLAGELVRIELEWRMKLGEHPSADEYSDRFPHLADELTAWLAKASASAAGTGNTPVSLSPETSASGDPLEPGTLLNDSPLCATSTPAAVRQLGEYDLLECIGVGGMGEVWKARHRRLGKLVALKLILPGRVYAPAAVSRFVREMKAVGQLDHPHLVEASDAGEIHGTIFLVMKLIDGHDLAKYVKQRGPLGVAEACGLARQVALGLQYLHERGLVHRDLKPSNVMRTPTGTVKILDLGLARWQDDGLAGDGGTCTGEGMGTPDFMAPEQIAHAASVDIRADLYALGGTLFHLLTGRAPFGHVAGGYGKMKAHESSPAPDVRTLRPEVPADLADLVARLLAKSPADRPKTPAEVAETLKNLSERDSPPPPVQPRLPHPRRWVWVAASMAALLASVALTVALSQRWGRQNPSVDNENLFDGLPLEIGKPTVLRFKVVHAERQGEMARERGLMGVKSFSTRLGDRAKVSVTLSRPVHGYLIAYATNGKEFLLDPTSESQPPRASEKLRYPPPGVREEYDLNDGVGLHVFVAVFSSNPLPAYAEWKKKHGTAPWNREPGRPGAVWRKTGDDLHAATEADPDVTRDPGAAVLGMAPVERLLNWWESRPGVEGVGLTGFAVTGAE